MNKALSLLHCYGHHALFIQKIDLDKCQATVQVHIGLKLQFLRPSVLNHPLKGFPFVVQLLLIRAQATVQLSESHANGFKL